MVKYDILFSRFYKEGYHMASFFVNGTAVTVEKNRKLLRYLRDELHLTSCKDGCSEGACGTCTVLIDGKSVRACTVKTDELEASLLELKTITDITEQSYAIRDMVLGKMAALRAVADEAETHTSEKYWPFPTYGELLFGVR